jgi:hypothetical protein
MMIPECLNSTLLVYKPTNSCLMQRKEAGTRSGCNYGQRIRADSTTSQRYICHHCILVQADTQTSGHCTAVLGRWPAPSC